MNLSYFLSLLSPEERQAVRDALAGVVYELPSESDSEGNYLVDAACADEAGMLSPTGDK